MPHALSAHAEWLRVLSQTSQYCSTRSPLNCMET